MLAGLELNQMNEWQADIRTEDLANIGNYHTNDDHVFLAPEPPASRHLKAQGSSRRRRIDKEVSGRHLAIKRNTFEDDNAPIPQEERGWAIKTKPDLIEPIGFASVTNQIQSASAPTMRTSLTSKKMRRANTLQAERSSFDDTEHETETSYDEDDSEDYQEGEGGYRSSDLSKPRKWTVEEDDALRQAVREHGAKHWKTIAKYVPDRNHVQCLQRWNKVLRPGLKKGPWTDEEDTVLQRLVAAYSSDIVWAEVSKRIPGRSAKQCRERWTFNLDPSINKADWTEEEDNKLLAAQEEFGNKWAKISTLLPGRTENAVKTRFKSLVRAKKREWTVDEDDKLLMYQGMIGSKWEEIAKNLPNRTKNAVKTRYKQLMDKQRALMMETSSGHSTNRYDVSDHNIGAGMQSLRIEAGEWMDDPINSRQSSKVLDNIIKLETLQKSAIKYNQNQNTVGHSVEPLPQFQQNTDLSCIDNYQVSHKQGGTPRFLWSSHEEYRDPSETISSSFSEPNPLDPALNPELDFNDNDDFFQFTMESSTAGRSDYPSDIPFLENENSAMQPPQPYGSLPNKHVPFPGNYVQDQHWNGQHNSSSGGLGDSIANSVNSVNFVSSGASTNGPTIVSQMQTRGEIDIRHHKKKSIGHRVGKIFEPFWKKKSAPHNGQHQS